MPEFFTQKNWGRRKKIYRNFFLDWSFFFVIMYNFGFPLFFSVHYSCWTSKTIPPSANKWVARPKVARPVKAAAAAAASSSESTSPSSSSPPVVTMTACSPLADVMVCWVITLGVEWITPAWRFRWCDNELKKVKIFKINVLLKYDF